jgi:hypothetical protein
LAGGNALLDAGISTKQRCLISQSRDAEKDAVLETIKGIQDLKAVADLLGYVGTKDEAHVLPGCWPKGCTEDYLKA